MNDLERIKWELERQKRDRLKELAQRAELERRTDPAGTLMGVDRATGQPLVAQGGGIKPMRSLSNIGTVGDVGRAAGGGFDVGNRRSPEQPRRRKPQVFYKQLVSINGPQGWKLFVRDTKTYVEIPPSSLYGGAGIGAGDGTITSTGKGILDFIALFTRLGIGGGAINLLQGEASAAFFPGNHQPNLPFSLYKSGYFCSTQEDGSLTEGGPWTLRQDFNIFTLPYYSASSPTPWSSETATFSDSSAQRTASGARELRFTWEYERSYNYEVLPLQPGDNYPVRSTPEAVGVEEFVIPIGSSPWDEKVNGNGSITFLNQRPIGLPDAPTFGLGFGSPFYAFNTLNPNLATDLVTVGQQLSGTYSGGYSVRILPSSTTYEFGGYAIIPKATVLGRKTIELATESKPLKGFRFNGEGVVEYLGNFSGSYALEKYEGNFLGTNVYSNDIVQSKIAPTSANTGVAYDLTVQDQIPGGTLISLVAKDSLPLDATASAVLQIGNDLAIATATGDIISMIDLGTEYDARDVNHYSTILANKWVHGRNIVDRKNDVEVRQWPLAAPFAPADPKIITFANIPYGDGIELPSADYRVLSFCSGSRIGRLSPLAETPPGGGGGGGEA